MMAENVGSIQYDASIDTSQFKAKARELDSQAKDTGESIGDAFKSSAKIASVALAGIGVGITAFAKSSNSYLKDLVADTKRMSRETGIATDEASRLLYVGKRLGIEGQSLSVSFGMFSKQIRENNQTTGEAALKQQDLSNKMAATRAKIADLTKEIRTNGDQNGNLGRRIQSLNVDLQQYQQQLNEAVGPLARIGVATKNADGSTRSFNEILMATADSFRGMPDGPEKTALALELFGRSGKDMIKVLNLGSSGILDLERQADKLGLTLTASTIGSVTKFIQSQKDLQDATDALRIKVGTLTSPVLAAFNNRLVEVINTIANGDPALANTTAGFIAFGGPVVAASAGVLGFVANLKDVAPTLNLLKGGMIGLIILGVLALVAGLIYLEQRFKLFSTLLNATSQAITPLINIMRELFLPVLQQIGSFLQGQLATAWASMRGSIESLKASLAPLMPTIQFLGQLLIGLGIAFTIFVVGAIVAVIAIIAGLVAAIARLIGFASTLASSFIAAVTGMRNGAAGQFGAIILLFTGIPGMIRNALGNLGRLLWGAGAETVQGFIDGIKSKINALREAITGVIKNVPNVAKGVLGVASPSKLFAQYGRWTIQGFVRGVDSQVGALTSSVNSAFSGLAPSLGSVGMSSLDQMPSTGNGGVVNNIGTINISSDVDGERLLKRLGRDDEITSQGVVSG